MPEPSADRIHLTAADAQALSERAMRGIGFDADEARILAVHVMDAALCGYEYSGLPKLLNIADSAKFKEPRHPFGVVKETAVSALIDGGNNVGMLAIHHAVQKAIDRATQHGFAIICLSNSWMSGRSAYYCETMARAGLIGIHTVSAEPHVAPFGGAKRMLGTNPIAFGFPAEGDPLVIDMGTSAFMGTDLQFRERLGAAIPEGVAWARMASRRRTQRRRGAARCCRSADRPADTRDLASRSPWTRWARCAPARARPTTCGAI